MVNQIKTSFVVLTYNRSDALLLVLRSLAVQCKEHHEIVIADDGSSGEQVEFLKHHLPYFRCSVRHVWHPDTGFTASHARNLGAGNSVGEYLVFLDGDCVPNKRFVSAHERLACPGYFVNGSRVLLSKALTDRVLLQPCELFNASVADWARWRLLGDVNKITHLLYWPGASGRIEKQFRWKQIRSCNFAVWKNDFEKINGFDEIFEGWGHEDADLVLRLHHLGIERKNGFFCTEVFHLWHHQNTRTQEGANYQRVLDRTKSGLVRADMGIMDNMNSSDVVVTPLN